MSFGGETWGNWLLSWSPFVFLCLQETIVFSMSLVELVVHLTICSGGMTAREMGR